MYGPLSLHINIDRPLILRLLFTKPILIESTSQFGKHCIQTPIYQTIITHNLSSINVDKSSTNHRLPPPHHQHHGLWTVPLAPPPLRQAPTIETRDARGSQSASTRAARPSSTSNWRAATMPVAFPTEEQRYRVQNPEKRECGIDFVLPAPDSARGVWARVAFWVFGAFGAWIVR